MSIGHVRDPKDLEAEREARLAAEEEFGCGCGYWTGVKLQRPHPKCPCEHAQRLRDAAKRGDA